MMMMSCNAPNTATPMTMAASSSIIDWDNSLSNTTRRSPLSRRQRGSFTTVLTRKSPFGNETGSLPVGEFNVLNNNRSGTTNTNESSKILVVGAGGLGCEILKDLAMMCDGKNVVRDVVVIDLGELNIRLRFFPMN